jgi:8-oxo-dGTP pyrophosphatase MutT (NUDIX family)
MDSLLTVTAKHGRSRVEWTTDRDSERRPAVTAQTRVSADALLRGHAERILFVDPKYKPDWDTPGGMAEANEPPHLTVQRELKEELGLDIAAGVLLVVDWVSPHGPWDDLLALIFDGGELSDEQIARIKLRDDELERFEFCTPEHARQRLRPRCRYRPHGIRPGSRSAGRCGSGIRTGRVVRHARPEYRLVVARFGLGTSHAGGGLATRCTLVGARSAPTSARTKMSSPGPQRRGGIGGGRRCPGCGTVLAADNTTRLCGRCRREHNDLLHTPPQLRNEFYETGEFRAAFKSRLIGKLFKAYRNHPRWLHLLGKALNQEAFGRWVGLSQGQVSKLESGKLEQHNFEVLRYYAVTLHLPQHMLWFDLPGQSRLNLGQSSRAIGDLLVPTSRDDILVATTGMDGMGSLVRLSEDRRSDFARISG